MHFIVHDNIYIVIILQTHEEKSVCFVKALCLKTAILNARLQEVYIMFSP